MSNPESEMLTVAETARLLRRSTEQVRRYLREGLVPGQRLGGQWFVRRADAEAWLTRRLGRSDFLQGLRVSDPDPLSGTIALGGSGGRDIASGKAEYLRPVREAG